MSFKTFWLLENVRAALIIRKVRAVTNGQSGRRRDSMDLKPCPKCNELPLVKIKHGLLMHQCTISCKKLGCAFYWPIIETGFSEQKALDKATNTWNKTVDKYF